MLTAEIIAHWLPSMLLAGDGDGRRLEFLHGGVFWDGDEAPLEPFDTLFFPWRWPAVEAWQCYSVKDATITRQRKGDVAVAPQAVKPKDSLRRHYEAEIRDRVVPGGQVEQAEVCLKHAALPGSMTYDEGSDEKPTTGWLRGYIAQKAQTMQPQNIAQKLAWLTAPVSAADLKELHALQATGEELFWVPVFATAIQWKQEATVDWDGQAVRALYGAAADGAALRVLARGEQVTLAPRNADAAIMRVHADPDHEPLRLGAMLVSDTHPWLPGLAGRAATAMDLPRWLVGWLQRVELPAPPWTADEQAAVREFLHRCKAYVVCAGHDVIGYGRHPGPDGRCLAEAMWRLAKDVWATPGDLYAILGALERTDEAGFLVDWTGIVETVAVGLGLANPLAGWEVPEAQDIGPETVAGFIRRAAAYLEFVSDPERARRLIRAQWSPHFGAALKVDARLFEQALTEVADPVRAQAEGLLVLRKHGANGSRWEYILGPTEGDEATRQQSIADALREVILVDAYQRRFVDSELNPRLTNDPFAAPNLPDRFAMAKFIDHVRTEFASVTMDVLFPSRTAVYPAAPPLRVAVDQPAHGNVEGGDAGGDLNDDLAGVLLFCRAEGQDWRSLSLVRVAGSACDPPEERWLLPSAVGEQDGVRVAYRRFDNENPSIVWSPEEHVAPATAEEESAGATDANGTAKPALELGIPNPHKAPNLHYGTTYEIAGAVMTNAGVLAPCLRVDASDSRYLAIPRTTQWQGLEKGLGCVRVPYRRRVPVGTVRFAVKGRTGGPLFPIPGPKPEAAPLSPEAQADSIRRRAIRPIACELPEWVSAPPEASVGDGGKTENQTLLLLFPQAPLARKRFQIHKPTTGFWNWFAWHGDWTAVDAVARIEEWKREVSQRHAAPGESAGEPVDDPAVADLLYYELEQLFPRKSTLSSGVLEYADGKRFRSGPVDVDVDTGAHGSKPVVTASKGQLKFTVPQGMVVRLTLWSLVDRAEFAATGRFHGAVAQLGGAAKVHEGKPYIPVTPVELWIEVARAWTPELREDLARRVWNALRVTAGTGRSLRAAVAHDRDEALAQLGRIEVRQQVWRWDGREVDQELLAAMLADPDRDEPGSPSLRWDGAAFATRPDYSHRSSPAALGVVRDLSSDQEVLVADLSDDPRSSYHRIAVQGFSRYEAVFDGPGILGLGVTQADPKRESPWRRALVKASRSERLPKPAVRFILPLTRDVLDAEADEQTAASVMLVLDDVWYAEAGLAEQMEVSVRVLKVPKQDLAYVNAGFDPTLTATALQTTRSAEPMSLSASLLGPYGLTHDHAAKVPKLRGSCFILRVPTKALAQELPPDSSGRLPWFMCEITARRKMSGSALTDGLSAESLASEWSARTWVQFAPNVDMLLPSVWREGCGRPAATVELVAEQSQLVCKLPAIPRFDPTFEERHERWLVLSERITDIQGHPGERYLATFVDTATGTDAPPRFVLMDGEASAGNGRNGYLRLVLVRRRKQGPALTRDRIWQSLFGAEGADEVVRDDALRGAPLVTGRVSITF